MELLGLNTRQHHSGGTSEVYDATLGGTAVVLNGLISGITMVMIALKVLEHLISSPGPASSYTALGICDHHLSFP